MNAPEPTRVLLLIDRFWPRIGGAEIQALRFVRAMKPLGYEFTVVTNCEDGLVAAESHQGIPIIRQPFLEAIEGRNLETIVEIRTALAKLTQAFQPHLIHEVGYGPTIFFRRYVLGEDTPSVFEVCLQFGNVAADEGTAIGRALRAASWVTTNSSATLDQIRSLVPDIAPRSSVIYYGVEEPDHTATELSCAPPRLLCFGRLVPEKGFDVAVLALPHILRRFPDARLVVAGDGPERTNLEHLVRDLDVEHAVDFSGWIQPEAIPGLVSDATLVLMPSRWEESLGLVAVETGLMARPVIASQVGGLTEVVIHDRTGITVPKEDPGALARAVVDLLGEPMKAVRLGNEARRWTLNTFSLDRYTTEYDSLYRRLLNGTM